MTEAAVTLILGVIAVSTFLLRGKQYPTFITATIFGLYLGGTGFGDMIQKVVTGILGGIAGMLG